jgi:uncharacterized protein (TIGR02001 family)
MRNTFACLVIALSTVGPAFAQTDDVEYSSDFVLDSSAAIVSDYRFRGWSLSDDKPAMQVDATLNHSSGLYTGVFASTIEELGIDDDGDGATSEFDVSAGWVFSVAGLDIDVGALAYLYPDASDVNYYVLPISLSHAFGGLSLTVGYEYTPRQVALGDLDGSYVWFGADWSSQNLPFWLSSSIGYEDGAWAPDGKTDWSLGAFYGLETLQLGLTYTGANAIGADNAVIAEIRNYF